MSFYPPKINERFVRPRNIGIGRQENDPSGTGASLICGACVRFFLQIDDRSKKIEAVRFKSDGCGFTIAAADVLADVLNNRCLTDLHGAGVDFWRREIEERLGDFPVSRSHCLEICVEAVRAALVNFREQSLKESNSENVLICTCFGVSEETIERVIAEDHAQTVEDVTAVCRAGGGCGACQQLIQEILDDAAFAQPEKGF